MSHTILTCPGCRSKLRFRADLKRTSIDCPRCAERIDLASAVSAEAEPDAPKQKKAVARPAPENEGIQNARPISGVKPAVPTARPIASRPVTDQVDDEEEFADEFDEDVERAKRETWVVLGVTGLAILAAVIAFPSVIRFFREDGSSQVTAVESSGAGATSGKTGTADAPLSRT